METLKIYELVCAAIKLFGFLQLSSLFFTMNNTEGAVLAYIHYFVVYVFFFFCINSKHFKVL